MHRVVLTLFVSGSSTEPNVSVGLQPNTDRFSTIHFLPLRSKGRKSILEKLVLRRSRHIKSVVLFEGDSILPPPGCLESSGWQFSKVDAKAAGDPTPRNYPRAFQVRPFEPLGFSPKWSIINLVDPVSVLSTSSKDASEF